MDTNKIVEVDHMFFEAMEDHDEHPNIEVGKTMVFFKYIDRGINDVKVFKEYIQKYFPDVKDIIVTNNYVYISDNIEYTFDDLYRDLGLRSLCVICHQCGHPKIKLSPNEMNDGIMLFVVCDIQEQSGESVVGDTFDEKSDWYEYIYDNYLAGSWECDVYGRYNKNYPFPMCGNKLIYDE